MTDSLNTRAREREFVSFGCVHGHGVISRRTKWVGWCWDRRRNLCVGGVICHWKCHRGCVGWLCHAAGIAVCQVVGSNVWKKFIQRAERGLSTDFLIKSYSNVCNYEPEAHHFDPLLKEPLRIHCTAVGSSLKARIMFSSMFTKERWKSLQSESK